VPGIAPRFYAYTRRLDSGTGERVMAGGTWAAGLPSAEKIIHRLRTPKGRYLPDPTFGIDLRALQKLGPTSPKDIRAAIVTALDPLVTAGDIRITALSVIVNHTTVTYALDYVDLRLPPPARPQRISGRLV
jgi:hypothetical protein